MAKARKAKSAPSVPKGQGARRVRPAPFRAIAEEIAAGNIRKWTTDGVPVYRDAKGRIVSTRKVKAASKGYDVRPVLATDRRELHGEEIARPAERVLSKELWGGDIARLVDDNAATGRGTVVKWKGKLTRIDRGDSGRLSDAFRVLLSEYVKDFVGVADGVYLQIGLKELADDDVLDLDGLSVLDDDLTEELAGDEEAERAAIAFRGKVEKFGDRITGKPPHAKGKTTSKDKVRTGPGKRSRSGDSKPGRKGRGK